MRGRHDHVLALTPFSSDAQTLFCKGRRRIMMKTAKTITAVVFLLVLSTPLVFAQSQVVGWLGTWTVTMNDESTVTWEVTDTWVSESGMSEVAYGIKNPGGVEFQIYCSAFLDNKHYYIEADHDLTIYDLPFDTTQYTELIPDEDFQTFTTQPGPYPIASGYKGTEPPAPCVASYLLGADDPRLDMLRRFRDEKMASSAAGSSLIEMYYEMSDDLIDRCEKNPAERFSLQLMLEAVIPAIYILL
jgi:hypothetical protein